MVLHIEPSLSPINLQHRAYYHTMIYSLHSTILFLFKGGCRVHSLPCSVTNLHFQSDARVEDPRYPCLFSWYILIVTMCDCFRCSLCNPIRVSHVVTNCTHPTTLCVWDTTSSSSNDDQALVPALLVAPAASNQQRQQRRIQASNPAFTVLFLIS